MISYEEALKIVLENSINLECENVSLHDSLGRVLAEDIFSDMEMPPFDKSAMDGFAIIKEDIDKELTIIETIQAGATPKKVIIPGTCSKIMTGAPVPEGANMVVMVEHTEVNGDKMKITKQKSATNICYQGEDIRKGDKILEAGTIITPAEIAALATVGADPVSVRKQPTIGIIATGTELVEPSEKPQNAQIRNSNSYQLYAQIIQAGSKAKYLGIAEDNEDTIFNLIKENMEEIDIFLLSGGVSMGEFDFVPGVLDKIGFNLLFEKVAIQPGKPTVFGKKDSTFVFGLPGNPVSTFMIFELFVKPFCYKLMGTNYSPVTIKGILKDELKRRRADRAAHYPVHINSDRTVEQIVYHGSGHINALSHANSFVRVPVGINSIPAGSEIDVTFIKSSI